MRSVYIKVLATTVLTLVATTLPPTFAGAAVFDLTVRVETAPRRASLTVVPSSGQAGSLVTIKARSSQGGRSDAALQRRDGQRWTSLARGRTSAAGRIRFRAMLPTQAARARYRVRFTEKGRTVASPRGAVVIQAAPSVSNPRAVADQVSSSTKSSAILGGVLYFSGWVDGQQGLYRVTSPDAAPELVWGPSVGETGPFVSLLAVNAGRLFLTIGSDGVGQTWSSDGTATGMVKLTDSHAFGARPVGDEVILVPRYLGQTFYRTDGTPAGTSVFDGYTGTHQFARGDLYIDAQWGYVTAHNGVSLETIVKSSDDRAVFIGGAMYKNRYYFGWNPIEGGQPVLWSSDGTSAGTRMEPDASGADIPVDGTFREAGGLLYFFSASGIGVTDGTAAGSGAVTLPFISSLGSNDLGELTPFRGGLVGGLTWNDTPFFVPSGDRSAALYPGQRVVESLNEVLGWGAVLVGEHVEYDSWLDFQNKLYVWDPDRPAVGAESAVRVTASTAKIPRAGHVLLNIGVDGRLVPNQGEAVTIVANGKTLPSVVLDRNYRAKVRVLARDLGVGRHVISVRYEGGTTLRPSPPVELTVRVTK